MLVKERIRYRANKINNINNNTEQEKKKENFKQQFPLNEEMEIITQGHLNKVQEKEFTKTKKQHIANKVLGRILAHINDKWTHDISRHWLTDKECITGT